MTGRLCAGHRDLLERVCLTSAERLEVAATSPRSRERRGHKATPAPRHHASALGFPKAAYDRELTN